MKKHGIFIQNASYTLFSQCPQRTFLKFCTIIKPYNSTKVTVVNKFKKFFLGPKMQHFYLKFGKKPPTPRSLRKH